MAAMIGRLWSLLIRMLLLVFGLAMFFGVMVFGILAAIGITAWALLRGRRVVPLDFGWKGPVAWRSGMRRPAPPPAAAGEVVDIDARVIDGPVAAPDKADRPG